MTETWSGGLGLGGEWAAVSAVSGYATTDINDFSVGTVIWNMLPNALGAPNGNFALTTNPGAPYVSRYLYLRGYGFSVPLTATVTGVKLSFTRKVLGATIAADSSVRLFVGGTAAGNNKASASTWPTVAATASYGGPLDTWGLSIFPSQTNLANFGLGLSTAVASGLPFQTHAEGFRITVYHTL